MKILLYILFIILLLPLLTELVKTGPYTDYEYVLDKYKDILLWPFRCGDR